MKIDIKKFFSILIVSPIESRYAASSSRSAGEHSENVRRYYTSHHKSASSSYSCYSSGSYVATDAVSTATTEDSISDE